MSLLPGAIFAPAAAGASFLSTILGNEVYAEMMGAKSETTPALPNSQTMALLAVDAQTIKPESKKADGAEVAGEITGTIVSGSALVPAVSPRAAALGGVDLDAEGALSEDISVYVVRQGDTISQIAEMFEVSVNTILWANDLKKGAPLKTGDTLLILPVSGVQHTVAKGETLQSIAKKYKVDTLTVTSFNGLEMEAKLAVGDELIIPDAEMPGDTTSTVKKGAAPKSSLKAIGGFIDPLPNRTRKSQGLHGRNAVDLAAPTGTRILASAGGTVLIARPGYNGGYGTYVIIQHANGTKTLYAHMSQLATKTGAKVSQGEVIGYVGSTGRSTGPHLHFEIHGAKQIF